MYGIDVSPARIEAARRTLPGVALAAGSADKTGLPDASRDLVCQMTLFSSVHDRHLRQAIAREMDRVLAPGGLLMWFDVRSPTRMVRAITSLRRGALRVACGRSALTRDASSYSDLVVLSASDVATLFPYYSAVGKAACVSRAVVDVGGRIGTALASIADLLPPLRSNLLLLLTKPEGYRE